MCYDERLFRSWATKKAQRRVRTEPPTERDRSQVVPIRAAPLPEPDERQEAERELEEVT